MKQRASYGDIEAARSAMVKLQADALGQVNTEMEWARYIEALIISMVVDWNLTDEKDAPLPLTTESLKRLDPRDGDFLVLEAQKRSQGRPEVQERPFEKPS